MEEQKLPSIRDMYNCTRENHDYNVIKHYESNNKNFAVNSKPTKKDTYLDQSIRNHCSPGPASTPPPTQTTPTNSPSGPANTPSSAKGPTKSPTSTKSAKGRRKIIAPLPTTTK